MVARYVQLLQQVAYQVKVYSHILPMVEINPSDMCNIYYTLLYVAAETGRNRMAPVVTIDPSLF